MSDKKDTPKPETEPSPNAESKGLNVEGKQTAGPLLLLIAAALATVGSVFWMEFLKPVTETVIGEENYEKHFLPDQELAKQVAGLMNPNAELEAKLAEAEQAPNLRKASLRGAIIGLLFCSLVGVMIGLSRKSVVGIVVGLIAGLVLGAAAGAGGGFANEQINRAIEVPKVEKLEDANVKAMLRAMAMHGALWASICVAVALTVLLTVGSSLGRLSSGAKALYASIGAALIATILFPFLTAVIQMSGVMAAAKPEASFVLDRWCGMLWVGMATGLVAISLGRTVGHEKAKRTKGGAV